MFVDETAELEDLLRLRRIVAGIERSSDDEQADLAAQVWPAEEEQREGAQEDVDSLDLLDPADEEDQALALIAAELFSGVGLTDRMEHDWIDAAGDHGDAGGIGPVEATKLVELDVARRDDRRGLPDRLALDVDPDVALTVDVLVQDLAFHEAERVEHLHDRDLPALLERAGDLGGEPVVRVDDVVRAALSLDLFDELRRCVFDELLGELVEVLVDGHLRPVAQRTRSDVDHPAVRTECL